MKRLFFHRFAADPYFVGWIGAGIRFSERGSGTGASRNPSNRSGIWVVPADSVPPGTGRTPRAENVRYPFHSLDWKKSRFSQGNPPVLPGVMNGGEVFVKKQDERGIQRAGIISIRMVASFSGDVRKAPFSWTSPKSFSFSASSFNLSAFISAVMTSLFSCLNRLILKAPS